MYHDNIDLKPSRIHFMEKAMAPHSVLLPENSMDRGAWWAAVHGVAKSRTQLSGFTFTFHFHALEKEMATYSCSCLENPRDGGAWWAAVYGIAQSQTRLKRLSSSKIHFNFSLEQVILYDLTCSLVFKWLEFSQHSSSDAKLTKFSIYTCVYLP